MRLWDSSAVVPLCVAEPHSARMRSLLASDAEMAVWWVTIVECWSALWRRHREGTLPRIALQHAQADLAELLQHAETILPVETVRDRARRLLATHALRAADALHLAAALVRVRDRTAGIGFVTLDARLREAAEKEGFTGLP